MHGETLTFVYLCVGVTVSRKNTENGGSWIE